MKKYIVLYTIAVLMFCFGIYLAQYDCYGSSLLSNYEYVCNNFNKQYFIDIPDVYPLAIILLSIPIATRASFLKQNDL